MKRGERTRFFCERETFPPKTSPTQMNILDVQSNKRRDGRLFTQLRPIFMKTRVISHASGSAYMEVYHTKVICGVYGPRQLTTEYSDKAIVQCEFKYASFSMANMRRGFIQDREEKELAMTIAKTLSVAIQLEKFPKSVIDINILILEDDGDVLGAALTCASLALADAGIHTYDLIAACSVSRIEGVIVLDPCAEEESHQEGSLTVAYMPSLNRIIHMEQTGEMEMEKTFQAIDLCVDACAQIHKLMAQHLTMSLLKKKQKTNKTKKKIKERKRKI
jgi:exosome complex component MTR3